MTENVSATRGRTIRFSAILRRIRAVKGKPCDARFPAACSNHGVDVLAITILVSSCLAAIFVVCFAIETRRARRSSLEHDSLIPFDAPAPKSHSK